MKTKLVPTRITDRREFTEEKAKLDRLNAALETASRRLQALNSIRKTEEITRYLGKFPNPMPRGMEPEVFDRMAIKVADEAEISDEIAKRLRSGTVKPPFPEAYDAETVEEIFEADRRVRLFKRAVELQSKRVLDQRNLAIVEVCNASRGERKRIARKVATLAVDLIRAVNEDNAFLAGLQAQDESLPSRLSPGAFPIMLHPDAAVFNWLMLALEMSEAGVQSLVTNPLSPVDTSGERSVQ